MISTLRNHFVTKNKLSGFTNNQVYAPPPPEQPPVRFFWLSESWPPGQCFLYNSPAPGQKWWMNSQGWSKIFPNSKKLLNIAKILKKLRKLQDSTKMTIAHWGILLLFATVYYLFSKWLSSFLNLLRILPGVEAKVYQPYSVLLFVWPKGCFLQVKF